MTMSTLNNIDVVILCGGLGKRLRSEIGEAQKTMAKVDNEPFLDILLKYLLQQGFRRAILCTGYMAESIEQHYRNNDLGIAIEFSKEEEPLGTGGAIKNAVPLVQSDFFFALNGDCFCPMNYQEQFNFHVAHKASATLALTQIKNRSDYGSIRIDEEKRIVSFDEKMDEGTSEALAGPYFVNVGIYCFNRGVFPLVPTEDKFSIEKDFFPKMVDQGFFGFEVKEEFIDIGTPDRLKKAQRFVRKEG